MIEKQIFVNFDENLSHSLSVDSYQLSWSYYSYGNSLSKYILNNWSALDKQLKIKN